MEHFDTIIDRSKTDSLKWDKYADDILPMWVADTDFKAPDAVIEALTKRVEHGIFGYTNPPAALSELIIERMQKLYDWQVEANWIVYVPGLVPALNVACRAYATQEQTIVTPSPVYYPFLMAPELSDRKILTIPMKLEKQRWLLDLESLEANITKECKVLLFCNPQNPGGTIYSKEELEQLAEIAKRHELVICSDEIHCDLLLDEGKEHIPFAKVSEDAAQRSLVMMAPSKTFNIAGLGCSYVIIPNKELRELFVQAKKGIVPDVSLLAYTAAEAAYKDGQQWLDEQLSYLRQNQQTLTKAINALPKVVLHPIEATYLAWIDVSELQLKNPAVYFQKFGLGLSPGRDFGDNNFVRLNFGCPKELLETAIERFENAVNARLEELKKN